MIDHFLQFVLVGLLMLTIVWCVLVHRKLRRLRVPAGETAEFVDALAYATDRAGVLITEIRDAVEAAESSMVRQERRLQAKLDEVDRLVRTERRNGADTGRFSVSRRGERSTHSSNGGVSLTGTCPENRMLDLPVEKSGQQVSPASRAAELMRALQGLR